MGTRSAAFAGKISNLRESILRIQNGTMPQPTCIDLANIMKYFSQVLHDFRDFKDIENIPIYAHEKQDRLQLIRTLPNFDYSGLYATLSQLVDILPLIPQSSNGIDQLGSNLLMLFKCLVPFLDQSNMETMPYLVTTLFMSMPQSLHKDILDTLCFNLLPFTIDQQQKHTAAMLRKANRGKKKQTRQFNRKDSSRSLVIKAPHCIVRIEDPNDPSTSVTSEQVSKQPMTDSLEDQGIFSDNEQRDENISTDDTDDEEYALLSVTSILMISFHYITEPMHHSQLVECLMKLKSNVFEDLLYVIAYGTTRARCPAVEILFRYWPDICPSQQDRKNNSQASKLKHIPWHPTKCQNKNCSLTTLGDDEAVKMCLDFKVSIGLSGLPPPMLICLDCVDSIYKQQLNSGSLVITNEESSMQAMDDYGSKFIDLLLPMDRISKLCENKKCKSIDKSAIGTCFDIECANYNGKKPIRYCKTCFDSIHKPCEANNFDVTLQTHICHSSLKLTIMQNDESVNNFVEAIISLLKEAAPADRPSKDSERYLRSLMGPMSQFNSDNKDMNIATEEKQLISQYGIWLMTGLCKTVEKLSDELLGRLLGMLFQWFHFTACLPDDQAGSALEKLKGECIKGWIMEVKSQRMRVFISCLLPHPIDCSKIGGHWEVWPDTAHQIKEGFKRLLCLVPYDIITDDVWDEIMPCWMECFRHEVPENELNELKILLSKVFDPELSPLGFETKQMYNFISSRFEDPTNTNQEQTLYWLQIITMLEIPIPIDFLYKMLMAGVKSLAEMRNNELNRLKSMSRMNEAQSMKSSPGSSSRNSSTSGGESHSSQDSTISNALSVHDDDVILPSVQEDSQSIERNTRSNEEDKNRPLTQKEKQAQARAAFSARLLQHASMLDAQHSTSMIASPTSSSSTVTTQIAASIPTNSDTISQIPINQLTQPVKSHIRPLKSTANSISEPRNRKDRHKLDQQDSNSMRPKLKLQSITVEEYLTNKIDNNLVCYILMLDILLKQLDLQEINSHRGLDGKEAQQAIELLNSIISTPWVGKHTCCDSLSYNNESLNQSKVLEGTSAKYGPVNKQHPGSEEEKKPEGTSINVHSYSHCAQGFERGDTFETCVFCEIISTFHQLGMFLIEFFSPVIEVSICEVSQDAANGEFDGKPDYSCIGLDHLEPSPCATKPVKFNFNPQSLLQQQYLQDPTSPFSPSYFGPSLKPEVLNTLPKELQLTYNLLVQFHQYQTPDIVSQLLQMIKLISLHSQVLSKSAKNNPEFITWCQHNMLVNKLWSLCQLESSEIARTCVPLLLHCITLPWGVRLFRDLVEHDFNSENWLSRFRAVERVVTIAYFCEPSTIKNSTLLQSTMASAFCFVVRCLDDIEAIVAQRALVSLEMMKTSSLKLLLWCLEVQFDCIIVDRPMILRSVFQLYNHLRDRRFLTWEFFLNRFDTIFLEAQIYLQQTGEIPSFTMQDLKNTNTKSEIYQKKIIRAKEALQETHHLRSLSNRLNEKQFSKVEAENSVDELKKQYKHSIELQKQINSDGTRSDSSKWPEKKNDQSPRGIDKRRAQSPIRKVMQHGRSTSSRYQSVAFLTSQSMVKRKNSKFMTNLAMQSVPPLSLPDKLHQHLPNSFVDDGSKLNEIAQENHVFGVVHRVCDEDRDTNHSLTFLLMNFLSKPDPSHPTSSKTLNRNHQIVLRHLNILMGYSIARKNFLIPASNLRLLPVFNAFLTSLPKVLDFNYQLGSIILDTCLPVLIYCPATEDTQYDSIRTPTYSLWLLNPLMRQSWLLSVMAFLYKYQFGQPYLKDYVHMMMWIVINTLESHLNYSALDSATLDRCLINVRDSTGTQDTSQNEEHVKPSTPGPQEVSTSGQLASASSVLLDSPAKGIGQHKVEVLELQTTKEEKSNRDLSSKTINHQQPIKASTNIKPSILQSPPETTSNFSSSTIKPLIKADTSDSLNVKAKLFQRKVVTHKMDKNKVGQASSSVTKINTMDASVVETKLTAEIINTTDERLLPIGLSGQCSGSGSSHKAKSAFDLPAAERLLPIGYNSVNPTKQSNKVDQHQRDSDEFQKCSVMEEKSNRKQSGGIPAAAAASSPEYEKLGQTIEKQQVHSPLGISAHQHLGTAITSDPQHPLTKTVVQLQHCTKKAEFDANDGSDVPALTTQAKNNRRRFGAGSKQSAGDSKQTSKEQEVGEASSKTMTNFVTGNRKGKLNKLTKEYVPKQVNCMQPSFSSPSLLNEQLAQVNRHSFVQEFSDKDLSMCLVILETFIHHEPSMAAHMLPNILRLVARYSSASLDSSQTGSNVHLVGGSMFVARQFIRVSLHDLMENNIFHQIFTSHFTGYEFYKSMATALADFQDLNQLAPLSKLFEDLNKQKNLPQAGSLMTILENVATYFECIIAESSNHSQTTWANFINNWENFLRKLILALPRYSGSTITTTNSSTGRADGTSSMAHANSGQAVGSTGTTPNIGATNQFLVSRSVGPNQENVNVTSASAIPSSCSMIMSPIMRIILSTSKISHLASCKTIVDPYSKIISYTVLNSQFKYEHLLEINHNCCRLYTRDREKYLIQRTIAYELIQVLKFRFFILEENLLILLLFILQDFGGSLGPKVVRDGLKIDQSTLNQAESYITNVSECLRQYIGDLLEFITDVHAISRINDNLIGSQPSSINRDSFGGHVKAAISQYLALEMSLNNGADNRSVLRYLPWLYSSPSLQQGPREFIECVSHIRQLSWIILGSLQHSTLLKGTTSTHHFSVSMSQSTSSQHSSNAGRQPIPIEKNGNVAEHVQVILAGFAEQSKESVLHMSGLFHAFLLCQLWTMYCENICGQHPTNSEQYQFSQSTLDDFWAKITPGVLRLVGHSRVMSEMVSTHFLQLIESLIESNSSILIRVSKLEMKHFDGW